MALTRARRAAVRRAAGLLALVLAVAPGGGAGQVPAAAAVRAESFAATVERLSEPGGFFDSDNLVSNETSYLHVLDGLRRLGVRGGAYIGVGPDQNFSYIAAIRPEMVYLVDIRRDNLLMHLVFKALFAEAPTRVEYLSLLFGRPPPPDPERWTDRPVEDLIAWVDGTPATERSVAQARERVTARIQGFGVPVSPAELQTIDRFHREFIAAGMDLRFSSRGRGPRGFYPAYRDLLTARDRAGKQGNYLVREADYDFLRRLQTSDRMIPVVGNLAGPKALAAVGRDIARQGLTVSAFYVSNVEFYLFGDGLFERYAATVRGLPRDERSVLIRSWFQRMRLHPLGVPGHLSVQLLQRLDGFVEGLDAGYASYWDLATRDPVPPA